MMTLVTKNAVIRMHFPTLTPEEQEKRMKAVERAAINLAIANRRAEALKNQREAEAGR